MTYDKNSVPVVDTAVIPLEITGSALNAIFEQREALLRIVGPTALAGRRDADEREAAALAERLDVSPRRSA